MHKIENRPERACHIEASHFEHIEEAMRIHGAPSAGTVPYTDQGAMNAHGLFDVRSEEHTSELQSQSTISYAVFCLKKKNKNKKKKKKK